MIKLNIEPLSIDAKRLPTGYLSPMRLRCTHKSFRVAYQAFRSPNPLALSERLRQEKGGRIPLKVPLFKGDLGGSTTVLILNRDVCTP